MRRQQGYRQHFLLKPSCPLSFPEQWNTYATVTTAAPEQLKDLLLHKKLWSRPWTHRPQPIPYNLTWKTWGQKRWWCQKTNGDQMEVPHPRKWFKSCLSVPEGRNRQGEATDHHLWTYIKLPYTKWHNRSTILSAACSDSGTAGSQPEVIHVTCYLILLYRVPGIEHGAFWCSTTDHSPSQSNSVSIWNIKTI